MKNFSFYLALLVPLTSIALGSFGAHLPVRYSCRRLTGLSSLVLMTVSHSLMFYITPNQVDTAPEPITEVPTAAAQPMSAEELTLARLKAKLGGEAAFNKKLKQCLVKKEKRRRRAPIMDPSFNHMAIECLAAARKAPGYQELVLARMNLTLRPSLR